MCFAMRASQELSSGNNVPKVPLMCGSEEKGLMRLALFRSREETIVRHVDCVELRLERKKEA